MKRAFVTLSLIFCMSIAVFSQSAVYTGDAIICEDDFSTAWLYLERSRFQVIQNPYSPDTGITGIAYMRNNENESCMSNVVKMSKTDNRIKEVSFVCTKLFAAEIASDLYKCAYQLQDEREVLEDGRFKVQQKTYTKGKITAVIKYTTDGSGGAFAVFTINRK